MPSVFELAAGKAAFVHLLDIWKLQKREEIHGLYCWEGDLKEPSKFI